MAITISVKSRLSQSITPSMPAIVSRSTRMLSVDEETKSWTADTSSVIVLRSSPVRCVS